MGTDYAFGDNDVAAERLAYLDGVFGPTSTAFQREWGVPGAALALDLGCGMGWTTQGLARACTPARTVGIDASAAFVVRARERVGDEVDGRPVAFVEHDVTATPFPTGPAELIFARYLLAHLPGPVEVAAAWSTQLAGPGSRLLLDEVERIDLTQPALATYLDISGEMLAARGNELYVGAVLGAMAAPAGTRLAVNRTCTISPTTGDAARLFAMNLATWRHDPWIAANVAAATIDRLAADLDALLGSGAVGEIVWTHRQVALERTA